MMCLHIRDLCWLPFFYHKDPHRIKFSGFYLLWGVKYQHLCDFSHFQKRDNYSVKCVNIFPRLELVRARPKISPHAKNAYIYVYMFSIDSSINTEHINIYIYTHTD